MDESENNDLFEYYIEIGAVEVSGVDEFGEVIFKITDIAKDLAPQLWKAHTDYIDKTLIELYNKDLISVEYDENLQATISLTPEAEKIITTKGIIPFDIN
jgi:hypothetical protein